jgi:hypothetical protein
LLLVFKMLLRRDWLGIVALSVWGAVTWAPTLGSDNRIVAAFLLSTSMIPWAWTLSRFGLVAGIVGTWVFSVTNTPINWNPSLWYGPNMLLGAGLMLTLAVYGFRTALGGRSLFGDNVFGDPDSSGVTSS